MPFPSPEDLPDPGVKPGSPTLQADSLPSEPQGEPKMVGRQAEKKTTDLSRVHVPFSVRIYFGEGNGYPLQHSCLGNTMDRGDWWTIADGIANSQI